MNTSLKILTAIALISVTIAAGVLTIKTLTSTPTNGGEGNTPGPTDVGEGTRIVKRKPDEKSIPKFSTPIEVMREDPLQPCYVPVNQPVYLQNIRIEGKTYHSRVMGKVEGQASKKDWGIRGSAYFTYIYGVESIGKIVKTRMIYVYTKTYRYE